MSPEEIEQRLAELASLGESVRSLSGTVAELTMKVHVLEQANAKKHRPGETVKWWDITEEARELEAGVLRGWERDVLRPVLGYYTMQRAMPHCWPLHIPALTRMEIARELWMTLWLSTRTQAVLTAQADFLIRQLPALADDIVRICDGCNEHAQQPLKAVASDG